MTVPSDTNSAAKLAADPTPAGLAGRLQLRPARSNDAQDLFGLLTLCFAQYPGCYVDPHDDLRDLNDPGAPRTAPGEFWVADDARGRVFASVALDWAGDSDSAELHRLYVRPDCQGRGWGAGLIRFAEDRARAAGCARVVLWSDTRFATAHRLYGRFGYVRVGDERSLSDISGSREYRFERELSSGAR